MVQWLGRWLRLCGLCAVLLFGLWAPRLAWASADVEAERTLSPYFVVEGADPGVVSTVTFCAGIVIICTWLILNFVVPTVRSLLEQKRDNRKD